MKIMIENWVANTESLRRTGLPHKLRRVKKETFPWGLNLECKDLIYKAYEEAILVIRSAGYIHWALGAALRGRDPDKLDLTKFCGYKFRSTNAEGACRSLAPRAQKEHKSALAVTKRVFQSIDCGTSCVTCCAVLLEPQLLDIMIVQLRNEKVSNHGSIPITIDCNVVAFIVFEEGFHHPIKRTKQSVFLDVTKFRHTLVD
ncbi:hypothetical protein TNCV_3021651 [Trichonephila clavipes]|nr:hypothetical protein TNCV_3021651 [Trichonephila clavipes]